MKTVPPLMTPAGQPRYLLLAQALMDDISAGRYKVGDLMPTEFDLCKQFNVSRYTVREAIRRLMELGLVTRQPGVGTRVKASRVVSRYTQTTQGIEDLYKFVQDVRLTVTSIEECIADEALAKRLSCPAGQAWLRVQGQRNVVGEDVPIALTDVYIARPYAAVREDLHDLEVPIYSLIEQRFGIRVVEVRQEVNAVEIEPAQAKLLAVRAGSAGLQVIRRYYAPGDELIEIAFSLHAGVRFTYMTTQRLSLPSGDSH